MSITAIAGGAIAAVGVLAAIFVGAQALRARRPAEELLVIGPACAATACWLIGPSSGAAIAIGAGLCAVFIAGAVVHARAMWPDMFAAPILAAVGCGATALILTVG